MSLILDALKKADQERREENNVPSFDAQHSENPTSPNKSKIVLIAAFGLLLFVAAFIILFFHFDSRSTVPEQNIVQHAGDNNPSSQIKKDEVIEHEKTKKQPAGLATEKIVASVHPPPKAELKTKPATKPSEQIAALYKKQQEKSKKNVLQTAQVKEPTKNTSASSAKKPLEKKNSIAAFDNVKTIKELPFSAQEKIPTLMYSGHHYSNKGASSIVINGKTLRERSTVTAGIRVEKILTDGVLFQQGNTTFKMQALNSWLNY